jgi:hypothetical protein
MRKREGNSASAGKGYPRGVRGGRSRVSGAAASVAWGQRDREGSIAVVGAAVLYLVGAALTATSLALPRVSSPAGVVAIAAVAAATAALLITSALRWRAGLTLAWIADLWGALLVALLCAATGGARSPFALIYFFAMGHAAAFQSRRRTAVVWLASAAGFLAPIAYGHVSGEFAALAGVGIVLAVLTNSVIYFALNRVREQRALLESLISATSQLYGSLDPADTLRRIAANAVPDMADVCVIDLVDGEGALGSTVAAARDPSIGWQIERLRRRWPFAARGAHAVSTVVERDEPCIIDDLQDAPTAGWFDQSDEYRRLLAAAGCTCAAIFPMVARGRRHGAISFMRSRRPYRGLQLAVLEDLTTRAATAFANARLYAERERVAGTLRRSLMPAALPTIPGIELASFFRPTGTGDEVGGDFLDVFRDRWGCWLVVGDVCGKGAEAGALTAFLRHTTIAYARESNSPADVLVEVNQAMLEHDFGGRFATVLLAHLQPGESGLMAVLASGGHPAALLVRPQHEVRQVGQCGTLLGVFEDPEIADCTIELRPGDVLTLYTDGLTDAHAPTRFVSTDEMIGALTRVSPSSSREVIDTLVELVEPQTAARDDIAILSAQVRPHASHRARRPDAQRRLHAMGDRDQSAGSHGSSV